MVLNLLSFEPRYIDVGRPDKKQGQLSDLYGALNIGQSIVFVNSRQAKEKHETLEKHCSYSLTARTRRGREPLTWQRQ